MKVAVVGLGYWGPNLVRNLRAAESVPEVVACDVDEARVKSLIKQYPGTIGMTDYGDVLGDPLLDAVVLAAAGLNRIGRLAEATELIAADTVLPAPGQGALAVECAASNPELAAQLAALDDPFTRVAVTAERSLLAALEAGCSAPVGALADLVADGQTTELRLRGVVGTTDGTTLVQMSITGSVPASDDEARALGRELAVEMLAKGAAGLMGERTP